MNQQSSSSQARKEVRAEEVLSELRGAGITTLEEFADQYAAAINAAARDDPRVAARLMPLGSAETPQVPAKPIVHPVLQRPLLIDGKRYDPKDVSHFNGRALHLYVDQETVTHEAILGFTNPDDLQAHLRTRDVVPKQATGASVTTAATASVDTGYCYEHINRGGAVLKIPRMNEYWNFALNDLTQVYRSCFLFWCSGPWNDIISSIRTEAYMLCFYEHINLQGSTFTVGPYSDVPSLVPYGWNDRISSLRVVV